MLSNGVLVVSVQVLAAFTHINMKEVFKVNGNIHLLS